MHMLHFTPKRIHNAYLGQGEGAGTVLQVTVAHSLFWCQGSGNLVPWSSVIQKERLLQPVLVSSVLVATIKYLPVLASTTTDCEGRFGPGLVWRMSEVCGWQEQNPSARRSTCSGGWRSRIRKKSNVASMVSLITIFWFPLFPCYLVLQPW